MISYRLINRNIQNKIIHPTTFNSLIQTYCSSSDSDNENAKKKLVENIKKNKSDTALQKLNVLLKQMIEEDNKVTTNNLNLAKPKPRVRNDKLEPNMPSESDPVQQKIIFAARNVAQSLKGNPKQTESDLLSKLLNATSNEEEAKNKPLNLSDVISGMKIDRTVKPEVSNDVSRAHQVRQLLDKTSRKQRADFEKRPISRILSKPKFSSQSEIEKVDLFGAKPLGIFTVQSKQNELNNEELSLKTWNALHERELGLAVTHPPENYFQEIILWTKQEKIWKFPIDNEQGMEDEQNVSFAEHIFLDKHLEDWCPTKGPIRHFMELVCVGLSKNPYLSSQAKKDHIMWYKDYFFSKKELLQEIGAMPTNENISNKVAK